MTLYSYDGERTHRFHKVPELSGARTSPHQANGLLWGDVVSGVFVNRQS